MRTERAQNIDISNLWSNSAPTTLPEPKVFKQAEPTRADILQVIEKALESLMNARFEYDQWERAQPADAETLQLEWLRSAPDAARGDVVGWVRRDPSLNRVPAIIEAKTRLSALDVEVAAARRELDELLSAGTAQTRYYQSVSKAIGLQQSLANQAKSIAKKDALEELAGHRLLDYVRPTVLDFINIDKRVTKFDLFVPPRTLWLDEVPCRTPLARVKLAEAEAISALGRLKDLIVNP
jgi:hypothetical protein